MLLVGGLKFGFDFPFQIWDVILPLTNSVIFQDGLLHHQPDSTIISTIVNYKLVYNPHEYYSYLRVINHH